MSSAKVATAVEAKKQQKTVTKAKKQEVVSTVQPARTEKSAQRSEVLSPSNIGYYSQPIYSPTFIKKKDAVIKGLTAQYWANKALANQP